MRRTAADRPGDLDAVAAALEAADCTQVEQGAGLLDDARRSLRVIAAVTERTLNRLADCWQGEGADIAWPGGDPHLSRLGEPLRRTREVLRVLDAGEFGQQLRRTANALAAGQARVRELQAQRAADPGPGAGYDERAQLVLHDVATTYQDIGRALGGTDPPELVPVAEPPTAAELGRQLRDPSAPVTLASGASVDVELFRPVGPVLGAGLPTDLTPPPPAGGGGAGGGGGMPMMPMMPMGGMGMGGMGGMGMTGQQDVTTGQRRTANAVQGDSSAWSDQDKGWNVLGRQDRIEKAQEEVREGLQRELGKFMKGDRNG